MRLSALAPGLAVLSCPAPHALPPGTPADPEDAGQQPRPPGMALDPVFALPSARRLAMTDRGLVVLDTPGDIRRVHRVLRRFFQAVVMEDVTELEALLKDQAFVVLDKTGKRVPALPWWQQRFARFDYRTVELATVYQEDSVETCRPEDIARSGRFRLALAPNTAVDVIARVPIASSRAGRSRLWGDEIWFALGTRPGGYQIVQMQEYLDLP